MEPQILLIANAVALGLRHGLDWDHLAAIMDIVATSAADKGSPVTSLRPFLRALMYALGHAAAVAILGLCALYFAAILPHWVDPLMERMVGLTLVALALWLLYTLYASIKSDSDQTIPSRGLLLIGMWQKLKAKWAKTDKSQTPVANSPRVYGFGTAFGVGIIHGTGAETGTQILLLTAITGSSGHYMAVAMLLSFIVGLLLSNSLVAIISYFCLASTSRFKPFQIGSAILTAACSLTLGIYFICGKASQLPGIAE